MSRPSIRSLYGGAVKAVPRDFDWSEGYPETWDYYEAATCDKCGKLVYNVHGSEIHSYIQISSECEGNVYAEGPMMNYFYPLPTKPDDLEAAQKALINLPLCLVYLQDENEWGLALTGGGMDLSWEICEAYMRLGYLPPMHFCDLPRMCGRGTSAKDRWIMAGCKASARWMVMWAKQTIKDIDKTKAWAAHNGLQGKNKE